LFWLATRDTIRADEISKAILLRHWTYRVPETFDQSQCLWMEVAGPDGVERTGSINGLKPGEIVKVFVLPAPADNSRLQWTVVFSNGSTTSTIRNPQRGRAIAGSLPNGQLSRDGILIKASERAISFTTNPSLPPNPPDPSETVLRIITGPQGPLAQGSTFTESTNSTPSSQPSDDDGSQLGAEQSSTAGLFTNEQIAEMSLPELRDALRQVASARAHSRSNAPNAARLKEEFDLLMARLQTFRHESPQ
jgi:hypothetical protein